MKKTWKHFELSDRKIISSGLSHNKKIVEIKEDINTDNNNNFDERSISHEVKRNRTPINFNGNVEVKCSKLNRWPYVCTGCKFRYSDKCKHIKFKYDAQIAQNKADANLVNSRKGIDLDDEEFKKLDAIIKKGTDENKSIYQIKIENSDDIKQSTTTLYRYINNGYLTTKRIDLPYAVKYKKRNHNKKYAYSENKEINRTGHTYLDYLAYIHKHPGITVWQLDFLGSIQTDSKSILTFIQPEVHFTLLQLFNRPNSSKVVKFFDAIEEKIGTDAFKDLIPVILTDRDPCFNDINGICFSKITGEERCKIFYCDPYTSTQKPNVENINKQIRKFFQKGKTIDNLSGHDVRSKNIVLLETPIKVLDGNTPKAAFKAVYDEGLYNELLDIVNGER